MNLVKYKNMNRYWKKTDRISSYKQETSHTFRKRPTEPWKKQMSGDLSELNLDIEQTYTEEMQAEYVVDIEEMRFSWYKIRKFVLIIVIPISMVLFITIAQSQNSYCQTEKNTTRFLENTLDNYGCI